MLPPKTLDEGLKAFATEKQWEQYEAYCKAGGLRPAAEALGLARSTIQYALQLLHRSATVAGYYEEATGPELAVKGVSTYTNKEGQESGWVLERPRGMDPDDAFEMPDPKVIESVATYKNAEGRITGQWT